MQLDYQCKDRLTPCSTLQGPRALADRYRLEHGECRSDLTVKTGIRFDTTGGLQFTAGAVVQRGYSLPITMVQAPGIDVQLPDPGNAALEIGSAATRWDTELRVRKTLTSKGPVGKPTSGRSPRRESCCGEGSGRGPSTRRNCCPRGVSLSDRRSVG